MVFKWLLAGLTAILWVLVGFYTIAGSIFMVLGLYDWSLAYLPVFLLAVSLFGIGVTVATIATYQVWTEVT